ncbi:MAG: winged helix-turn-helix transcriptional regulator [Desulfurococcaceae archaeon]|nr:winged helix-turn-helix transcriptional regulator [Desulfurococcaceae archaeon]
MSVEQRILRYLRENPGATPRAIADALGISLTQVRVVLNRLRDLGYVTRVPGGGYYARAMQSPANASEVEVEGTSATPTPTGVLDVVKGLESEVRELRQRLEKLEKEVRELRIAVESLGRTRVQQSQEQLQDRFTKEVKARKVLKLSEALAIASKPLDEYVKAGVVKVFADLVVDREFFEEFSRKFPIKKAQLNELSDMERELLNSLIKEGLVYLYGGREYRLSKP